jgi:hypothetical protein
VLGYPIRKPPDQRSVANSPGHIAGSHVLHRLSMPRHPPCALTNLPNKPPTHTTHMHTDDQLIGKRQTKPTKHEPTPPSSGRNRSVPDDQTIKDTLRTTHTTTTRPPQQLQGPTTPACDARVHYPEIKYQEAQPAPTDPIRDQRRLMPQTPNSAPCNHTRTTLEKHSRNTREKVDVFH